MSMRLQTLSLREGEPVAGDAASDRSLFEDLERVAKGLSVVTDQASVDELRRLFDDLQDDRQEEGSARGEP